MPVLILLIFFFSVFVYAEPASDGEPAEQNSIENTKLLSIEPAEIVNLVSRQFSNYASMQLSFRENKNGKFRRGEIIFQKPHNIKINYYNDQNESTMEIICTAEKMYVHLVDLKTVFEQDLLGPSGLFSDAKSDAASDALKMLNLKKLIDNYNFNFIGSKTPVPVVSSNELSLFRLTSKPNTTAYHFYLTPKDITSGMKTMEMRIGSDGIVHRAQMKSGINNSTIDILLFNHVFNPVIPDDSFEFITPADVQIVKNTLFGLDYKKRIEEKNMNKKQSKN